MSERDHSPRSAILWALGTLAIFILGCAGLNMSGQSTTQSSQQTERQQTESTTETRSSTSQLHAEIHWEDQRGEWGVTESGPSEFEITEPAGAFCSITSDNSWIGRSEYEVPFRHRIDGAYTDDYVTIECELPDGQQWRERVDPRPNHYATITFEGYRDAGGSTTTHSGGQPRGPAAMGDAEFKDLEDRIDDEAFADDQLGVLRTAASHNDFTADQVVRLLDLFTHSSDKIDALRVVAGNIVDPENQHVVIDAFVHSSDKDEAESILQSH